MLLRLATQTMLLFSCACASMTGAKGDVETLKPAVDTFHQRARWSDFRGASELIVPEKRDAFVRARDKMNDAKDLHITDYDLEDAKVADDRLSAVCVWRMRWYRLPSVTEQDAIVRSRFIWKNGTWLLDSQDGGPFASELVVSAAPEPAKDGG